MGIELSRLKQDVQFNCNVSDARYAGQYTLCIYLLKMREYYRWERGLDYGDRIDNEEIGSWITERETQWDAMGQDVMRPIEIGDTRYDAFDSPSINQHLQEDGLVYSAGYVLRGKPHFFLADLERQLEQEDYRIIISGREYARELSAPPALSQDQTIFIRSESLRRTIWEKVEESRWNKKTSPLVRAIESYDFVNHTDASLQAMCDNELQTLIAHEIGEIRAGKMIGAQTWSSLLSKVQHSPLELMLRAIRDNLADCISTLPDLVDNHQPARLHFFIASLSNMRKALFPSLRMAYDDWLDSGSTTAFEDLSEIGIPHWNSLIGSIVALYEENGLSDPTAYETLIESHTL
jgi:hypothetical protein